jgi:hypothetical protein
MSRALAADDPGNVRGPWYWLLDGTVALLHALLRWHARTPVPAPRDDLAEVRALAEHVQHTDPSFAQELWAIAARHETAQDAQASVNP